MVTWDDFNKIWASTSPLTPYSFAESNYKEGWNFVGSAPPARQMWDSIQKTNDEKFKYLRDNFGTPNIVTQASQMTDTDKVYVYLGSEAGWNNGHWYYYDEGTSSWADGGVYNSVAFVTDTTLSIAGQPADAKATGDALALKSDLAGCTFTGNVGINADLSVTGDATIGTDLSVTGVSTLTGNVSAGADVTVVGDVSSANLTTGDATIGGDLSVTGTSTLAGNITTSGDISADNISATTNATVGGNLSVTGVSTLTGDINAGADIVAVGDVSADNLTTTTNATVGGSLSVAGTSTLTGNVTTSGDISAVGDITSANISTTNATIGGNATVTGDVSCANLTTSADATVGGDLTVTGDSTFADASAYDLVVNNDLSVAGDSSLTNLSVSGTTALAGTSTAPTPSADDNSTKIATTEYVQTEIKPIEVNADIVDKRVTNIEKLLQGNLYDYQTDTDSKYTKTVPQGAMPYASLEQIGGRTLVWNQLSTYPKNPTTIQGVAVTYTDESIILNGTAEASFNIDITNVSPRPYAPGHKILMRGCPSGGDRSTYCLFDDFQTGVPFEAGDGIIYTQTYTTGLLYCKIHIGAGTVCNNLTFTPQITDLTLMYGSGNEPSTVAEFQQQFPAVWYAYNPGTLLSAGVTEVKSVGKNLADYSGGQGYPSNTDFSNVNKRILPIGKYVLGLSNNNYYQTTQVTSHTVTDNSITITSNSTGYGCVIPFVCEPSTNYAFSCTMDGKISVAWYQEDGTWISNTSNYTTNFSATSSANAHYGALTLMITTNGGTATFSNIQIEKGNSATSYSPAGTIATYPIPAEIQALEGYGWSAGSVYNYIDYERKVFVKRVGSCIVDGTTLYISGQWGQTTSGYACYSTNLPFSRNKNGEYRQVVADKFTKSTAGQASMPLYSFLGNSGGVATVSFVLPSTVTTVAQANTWFTNNPTTVYYELDDYVETDISAYITDDNIIEVEAGGTLTFPNSNGDDYRIDVPSSETYMVDLQASL